MIGEVLMKEHNVRGGDPHAVGDADKKTVNKLAAGTAPGNHVGAGDEDCNPEQWLNGGRNHEYGPDAYQQPEQREFDDSFPVHTSSFELSNPGFGDVNGHLGTNSTGASRRRAVRNPTTNLRDPGVGYFAA